MLAFYAKTGKNMIKKTFITFISVYCVMAPWLAGNLQAGEPSRIMTLKDCMEYAISNSTKLRIQQAATGDAKIARRDAILQAFTPNISSSTYAYYNFGRSIDPETNTYFTQTSFHNSYSVSAGFDLFNGFQAVNNLKISKTGLAISESQEKQAEADICLAVMEASYNVVYNKRLADIYEEQVSAAELALTKAVKQEEIGQKGHADVVQMEADLADRKYDLITVRNSYKDQLTTLSDLMFWPEDEELLKQFVERASELGNEGTKLILVPHEINEEHLHDIFQRFKGRFVKYSDISAMPSNLSRVNILRRAQVMVIDTIGLLSSIYQFGQVAYIGGGFGEGIHNTIEAAAYGVPVVFGPNYHHFREAQGLIDAGAARSIKNYAELEAAFTTALEQHETIGAKAAEYVQSELGATDKIYKALF